MEDKRRDQEQSAWISEGETILNQPDFYDEMTTSVDEGRAFVFFIFTRLLTPSPVSSVQTNV